MTYTHQNYRTLMPAFYTWLRDITKDKLTYCNVYKRHRGINWHIHFYIPYFSDASKKYMIRKIVPELGVSARRKLSDIKKIEALQKKLQDSIGYSAKGGYFRYKGFSLEPEKEILKTLCTVFGVDSTGLRIVILEKLLGGRSV